MESLAFKVALERFYLPKLIENGYAFAISVHLQIFMIFGSRQERTTNNTARTTSKQQNLKEDQQESN